MTREQAARMLAKITGTTVKLEVEHWSTGISSPERRATAAVQHARITAEYEAAKTEYDRIIREHAELQRLAALRKRLYAERERLSHEKYYRKFQALKPSGGIGWEYIGSGDTWAEVIEAAKAKARK